MMRGNYWQAAVGVAAMAALMWLFWPREEEGKVRPGEPSSPRQGVVLQVDPGTPRDRNVRGGGGREEAALTEHQADQLGEFILPLVEGRQVSLRGAVRILMAAYADACRRTRTVPLELEFAYPAEEDEARMVFSIERGNFMGALNRIATLAGYRVRMDGLAVGFEAIEDQGEKFTRTFRTKEDFKERLAAELARLGIPHGPLVRDLLEAAGVVKAGEEGSVAEIAGGGGTALAVKLTVTEMDRLEALLEGSEAAQFKAGLKLIRTPTALALDPPPDLTQLLVEISGKPGVQLTTMPSITMRESQPGTIEIVREEEEGWTGTKVDLDGERMGLSILTRDTVQYRPDDHPKPYLQDTRYSVLADGVPEISLVGEKEGEFLYRILTVEVIDAAGRPVGAPAGEGGAHAVATPVPGSPGMVFSPYNNKVVDVKGLPSGTLVADPHYPVEEKKFFRVP